VETDIFIPRYILGYLSATIVIFHLAIFVDDFQKQQLLLW